MTPKKPFFGWYVVGVGLLSLLFSYGLRNAFAIFFPFILEDLHGSRALISGVISLGYAVNLFLTPVAGYAVDRYGAKKLIAVGACFSGISLLCMPLVRTLWHFYLLYGVTFAIGVNFMGLTVINSMCSNWFVKHRSTAIAVSSAGSAIGAAIFCPLSELLIIAHGWKMAFAFIGAAMMFCVIPLALIFAKQRPEDMGLQPDGEVMYGPAMKDVVENAFTSTERVFAPKEFFHALNFWLIATGWMIAATVSGLLIHIVPYCLSRDISTWDAAWALGYMALASIASRFEWTPISHRMKNHKFSCAAGLFIYAIGWVALLFLDNTLHLYIVVTIFGIGRAGVEVMPALVAEQFGRLSMSRVYGFINVFGAAGGVVGPILAGWIYDSTSSYILAWLTGAVISFVGAILFILVGNSPYEEKLKSDATPRGAL